MSNLGNFRNVKLGRELKAKPSKDEYPMVGLFHDHRSLRIAKHRVVCAIFHGDPPSSEHRFVHHKNRNKLDARAENLVWVTPRENSLAYFRCPNTVKKEKNGRAVVQYKDNILIERFRSLQDAANAFSKSRSAIFRIVNGKKSIEGYNLQYEKQPEIEGEEWKASTFVDNWQVSNMGRVRNSMVTF